MSDAAPDSPGRADPSPQERPFGERRSTSSSSATATPGRSAAKFEKDARRLVSILFNTSPFKERKRDFNVWGLCPESSQPGISRPSTGVHRRSRIGATYDAFGSERYVLTFDNRSFRDVASFAPYEFVEILVNGNTYGGGGIFGLYSTVAADSLWAPYVFVHEFGHHFAGLADEYFTSESALLPDVDRLEPWEPNVTALEGPRGAEVEGAGLPRNTVAHARGRKRSSRRSARPSRSSARRSAPTVDRSRRWTPSSTGRRPR